MQTHLVPKITHQNIALIVQLFNYGKNSFIVLVPGGGGLPLWRKLEQQNDDCKLQVSLKRVAGISNLALVEELKCGLGLIL